MEFALFGQAFFAGFLVASASAACGLGLYYIIKTFEHLGG